MIAAAMAVLISAFASGQTASKKANINAKIEQELMRMERDWSAAFLRNDVSVIDRILADDFIGTDGRGLMSDKAQEIEDARSAGANHRILSEVIDDFKIRIYGDAAIVNARATEKVLANEKEFTIQYRRTDVYVKRNGRWQCVSFHGSRVMGK